MHSFVTLLLISLTFNPLVVKSDFCSRYLNFAKEAAKKYSRPDRVDYAVPNLNFISTKDKLYLYLKTMNSTNEEWVYEFDASCTTADTCPRIGGEKTFSQVFSGLSKLKNVFIQDGFTYFLTQSSLKWLKYENTAKIGEIDDNDFWKNVSHATVYEWKDDIKTVKSRFVPPKSPKGPPRYGFSFDTFNGDGAITVEVQGNYETVNIVKHMDAGEKIFVNLYTFGDYLVPDVYYGYLPLPNGDDIFNFVAKPAYIRKSDANLYIHRYQDLNQLFGCDKKAIPEKILTDTRGDNIYPSYFKI